MNKMNKVRRAFLAHAIPHRLLEFRLTSDKATSLSRENPYLFGILLNRSSIFFFQKGFSEAGSLWKSARRAEARSDETSLRIKSVGDARASSKQKKIFSNIAKREM